jgi:hypothetical protein
MSASLPNPKFLSVVSIAAGSAAEAQKVAFPCRLWGVAARWKGALNGVAIAQFLNSASPGSVSAVSVTMASGPVAGSAAAGQGFAWFENFYGMKFSLGITAILTDAATGGGWDLLVERIG